MNTSSTTAAERAPWRRGVLNPLGAGRPGSPWWRGVNERLLYDGCETVALAGGVPAAAGSSTTPLWEDFVAAPRLAPLGRLVGDPRLGMAGVFLSLGRVLPDRYPLKEPVSTYSPICST
jgi:hypothetical protein